MPRTGTRQTTSEPLRPLTPRQQQILRGIAAGMSNAEIGEALYLTPNSVKTIVKRLYRNLGARGRGHAVELGHQHGYLSDPDRPGGRPPGQSDHRGR